MSLLGYWGKQTTKISKALFKKFNELGDSLAAQFDKIEVLPNLFINGKFTLGENIGMDIGNLNPGKDKTEDLSMLEGFNTYTYIR